MQTLMLVITVARQPKHPRSSTKSAWPAIILLPQPIVRWCRINLAAVAIRLAADWIGRNLRGIRSCYSPIIFNKTTITAYHWIISRSTASRSSKKHCKISFLSDSAEISTNKATTCKWCKKCTQWRIWRWKRFFRSSAASSTAAR